MSAFLLLFDAGPGGQGAAMIGVDAAPELRPALGSAPTMQLTSKARQLTSAPEQQHPRSTTHRESEHPFDEPAGVYNNSQAPSKASKRRQTPGWSPLPPATM
jgi:hypothetical protein